MTFRLMSVPLSGPTTPSVGSVPGQNGIVTFFGPQVSECLHASVERQRGHVDVLLAEAVDTGRDGAVGPDGPNGGILDTARLPTTRQYSCSSIRKERTPAH